MNHWLAVTQTRMLIPHQEYSALQPVHGDVLLLFGKCTIQDPGPHWSRSVPLSLARDKNDPTRALALRAKALALHHEPRREQDSFRYSRKYQQGDLQKNI